ncbi:MAG TPA: hypothetical protein VFJ90_05550 [Candidatus Didemnitutus sp.]|nr:hypothetical protein [Candidatus Didemnitutus sp.]
MKLVSTPTRLLLTAILAGVAFSTNLLAYTKAGTTYTTTGAQSDVAAAISNASPGDTVNIPAGTFTWGATGALSVNKAITLSGAGQTATTIPLATTGPTYGNGTISIEAAATVKSFGVNQSGTANTTVFSAVVADGWRITDILYNSGAVRGYFVFAETYGLIDSCTINGGGGTDELIFARGHTDSWQTPSSMGTGNAIFIEDCTFNNDGYVCDMNSNARGVIRFCTINGNMKVDGHGVASNTPARSVRHMEVYDNDWKIGPGAYYTAMEIRGGTGMIFDNVADNASSSHWFFLTDYGYLNIWPNFNNLYQTPANYPIKDQIGVGMDPKAAASEPMYVFNNLKAGSLWLRELKDVPAAASTAYGSTFYETDLIAADRDFFWQTSTSFNGSSGVGRGTKSQMQAITPTKKGVGYWVTNEGEWNSLQSGFDGQLYVWSGSAWVLKYTPYTYPHPLRGPPAAPAAPSNTAISISVP